MGAWTCSSLVKNVFSMCEALASIPSTEKNKKEKERK
jgi:hypothetical protein